MLSNIEKHQKKRKYTIAGFDQLEAIKIFIYIDRNNYSKLISDQNIYRNEEQ